MTETDEPTIRDVLAAIDTLKNEMSETEERLRGEIHAGREHLKAMETRLNAKIESVKAGLKADIAAVREELKNEIDGAFAIHETRIHTLEAETGVAP